MIGTNGHERRAVSAPHSSLHTRKGTRYARSSTTSQRCSTSKSKHNCKLSSRQPKSKFNTWFVFRKQGIDIAGGEHLSSLEGADGQEMTVREKRLQLKVQELTGALERVTQSAELRSQQSAELVSDVKKANGYVISFIYYVTSLINRTEFLKLQDTSPTP